MELIQKITKKMALYVGKYWRQFLFLGIFSQDLFGFLLQTIIFVQKKSPLGTGEVFVVDIVTKALGIICVFLFCLFYMKREDGYPKKEHWIRLWKNLAVITVTIFVMQYIPVMVLQFGSLKFPKLAVVLSAVIAVIGIIFLIINVLFCIVDIQPALLRSRKQIIQIIRKHPICILATVGIILWSVAGDFLLLKITSTFVIWMQGGYVVQLTSLLFYTIVHGIVYISYFDYVREKLNLCEESEQIATLEVKETIDAIETTAEIEGEMDTDNSVSKKRKIIFSDILTGLVTIIALFFVVIEVVGIFKQTEREDIQTYMAGVIDSAREEIESGNTDEGIRRYVLAQEYMQALDFYVEENGEELRKLTEEYPTDEFYWQLYYAYTSDVELLKEKILQKQDDIRLYHELLAVYAEEATLDETSEEGLSVEMEEICEETDMKDSKEMSWQDFCIQKCLDTGSFCADYACIDKESLRRIDITALHKEYDEELSYSALLQELVATGVQGKIDEETLYRILDMADANEDNLAYQLVAIEYGAEYLHDDASHYERVLEAAKRYDSLYAELNPSQEDVINEKLYLAEIMIACEDYASALELLRSVDDVGNVMIEDYVMICHSELEQLEELALYTEKLIQNQTKRANVYYYAALSTLKLGQLDASLTYGVKLSEMVISIEGKDREFNNAMLNSYVQYLCISDKYQDYIQYKYRIKDYSEEQMKILEDAPLLRSYIEATNCIYNAAEYEQARVALDEADKTCPNLSITWFLRGTSYFNEKKYEDAMECFKSCIAIDPENLTALYCMAALYDQAGEYELSYQLCSQIIEQLPYVNHETDWYGIAYHVNALKEKLSPYVTGDTQ